MEILDSNENGVQIIRLAGRLDAPAVPETEKVFRSVIHGGAQRVMLDLSGVEYISSSGLRLAIMLLKAIERAGGQLAFCSPSPFVSEVFSITHLSDRFDVYSSREEALAILGK